MRMMQALMNKFFTETKSVCLYIVLAIFSLTFPQGISAQESPELIKLKIYDDFSTDALLYQAKGEIALVLAHQSGYRKESWDEFAKSSQLKKITSISLERSTPEDVNAAINYLIKLGYGKITLIGASIGGGAILQALAKKTPSQIQGVILMAPSYGPALKSNSIRKLVIVTDKDFYGRYARDVHKEASAPKKLIEYTGREHAQELFKGPHKTQVTKLILDFIQKN